MREAKRCATAGVIMLAAVGISFAGGKQRAAASTSSLRLRATPEISNAAARQAANQTPMPTQGALEITSTLGRKLYALQDDDAVRAARQKLAANPKDAKLVLALSLAEAGRRQYREAVATCTKGLATSPNSVDLLVERGHRELGLRQFAAAQKDLEHAAAFDPKRLDAGAGALFSGTVRWRGGRLSQSAGRGGERR